MYVLREYSYGRGYGNVASAAPPATAGGTETWPPRLPSGCAWGRIPHPALRVGAQRLPPPRPGPAWAQYQTGYPGAQKKTKATVLFPCRGNGNVANTSSAATRLGARCLPRAARGRAALRSARPWAGPCYASGRPVGGPPSATD